LPDDHEKVTNKLKKRPMITVRSRSRVAEVTPTNVRRSALDDIKHGTEYGWRRCREANGGVACEACRKAKNEAWEHQRQQRLGKPVPPDLKHGRYVHEHYGCQCDICTEDTTIKARIRKQRSRARKEARS